MRKIVNQHCDRKLKLNFREDIIFQFQQLFEPLLLSSLGDRISEVCFNVIQEPVGIEKTQEPFSNILIGLRLNPEKSNAIVERGPTANLPEVVFLRIFIKMLIKIYYFCFRPKNSVHFGVINHN